MGKVHSIGFLQDAWAKKLFELASARCLDETVQILMKRTILEVLPQGMHEDEIQKVEYVLNDLIYDDESRRSEPLLASLLRLEHETGKDVLAPLSGKLTPDRYMLVRQAMGVIALAWQYHEHPDDVILSTKRYRQSLGLD